MAVLSIVGTLRCIELCEETPTLVTNHCDIYVAIA